MAEAEIIAFATRRRPGGGSAASSRKPKGSLTPPASGRSRRPRITGRETVEQAQPPTPVLAGRLDDRTASDSVVSDSVVSASVVSDPVAAALAFVRRRVTGDYEVDELGFDADLTSTVFLRLLRPLAEKWFRIEVRGIANLPRDGGALLVSNHSGTLPMDALMTSLVVHDHAGRHLRALGADLVFTLPFVSELARKGGATLACGEDAVRLLADGKLVGVWPEGFKGVGKPYRERYKLQRFGRGGFVAAAIRTGVPIIPCSVVGAEEIYPMIGDIPFLARLLGLPYVPVTPLFPWLGLLGTIPLPSKWVIEFGEPIRTDAYPDGAADDPMLVFNVADQVRETIQQTLRTLLMHRGSVFG